jgi:carboxyl-terminal processing protease
VEDYYRDIIYRYEHGEFFNRDSINVNDSLVYRTVGGRKVYGGGGIMPDVFVGRDTSNHTDYYYNLRESGVIYQFALDYSDRNRNELSEFETVEQLAAFLDRQPIGDMLISFAKEKGVEYKASEYLISKALIVNETKAYIARNILDNEGFYPIILKHDEVLNKALEVIRSGAADSILQVDSAQPEDS